MNKRLTQSALCLSILAAAASTQAQSWITSASSPALTGATIEGFESVTPGIIYDAVSGPLTFGDATDMYSGNSDVTITDTYAGTQGLSGLYMSNYQGDDTIAPSTTVQLTFASPQSAVGFLYALQNDNWTFNAYNTSGTLLGTHVVTGSGSGAGDGIGGFIGFSESSALISYVTYSENGTEGGNGDYIGIDNVTYRATPAPTPEPTTLALAGLGFASLLIARRKQA